MSAHMAVIPAKAGIQSFRIGALGALDSRLRGNDGEEERKP